MRFAIIALSGFVLGISQAAAIDITTCGQTVPRGEVGVLQAPLVCNTPTVAVTLERRATLNLNGHSLTSGGSAVHCPARAGCIVDGGDGAPAEITGLGTGFFGLIGSATTRRVTVRNVRFKDFVSAGIASDEATLILVDVETENCGEYAIRGRRAKLTNVVASGSDYGVFTARGVTGAGIDTSNNAIWGISAAGASVRVTDLTATNNGTVGVFAKRLRLSDSTLTGNGFADVVSPRQPRLRDTTCGVSSHYPFAPSEFNWGVCSLD